MTKHQNKCNLNKIELALKDINIFFEIIEKEKIKIKKETDKEKKLKMYKNKNKKKNDNDDDDIDLKNEKKIFKKFNICEAHFKKGYCHMILLDYNFLAKFLKVDI